LSILLLNHHACYSQEHPQKLVHFGRSPGEYETFYDFNSIKIDNDGIATITIIYANTDSFSHDIAKTHSLGHPVKYMIDMQAYDCMADSYRVIRTTYHDSNWNKIYTIDRESQVIFEAIKAGSPADSMLKIVCKYRSRQASDNKGTPQARPQQGKQKQDATKDNITNKYN
jgi:hypothetical protein